MITSADNLCFGVTAVENYAALNLKTTSELLRIETTGDVHSLDLAEGLIRLQCPSDSPCQFGPASDI